MSFLDEDFLARWAAGSHEPLGTASGTVALKTVGGPDGKVNVGLRFEDGILASAAPGPTRGADLTLEAHWQLAADAVCGEADPAVPYMSGDLKVSGNMALWLELLPAWQAAGTLGSPPLGTRADR